MKIKSIAINNFRAIKDLNLDLTNPFTNKPLDLVVLSGPNGCGKTSVLESIVIALTKPKTKNDKVFSKINERNKDKEYIVSLEILDNQGLHRFVKKSKQQPSQSAIKVDDSKIEYYSSWREPRLGGVVSPSVGIKGRRHLDTEENRLINFKQLLVNAYVRDTLTSTTTTESDEYSTVIQRVEKALSLFFSEETVNLEIRPFSEEIDEGFDVMVKLKSRGEDFISLDSLSSGEIELFSFMNSVIRDHLSEGILLIDEPELHLHVSWHRIIIRVLKELLPNTQIICATHSLEILSSVKSYERFLLQTDRDYL